ncbi:sugar ABC transporter permease [Frondihabitans sucicola]|uniref:Sugar ABC transporter permease n=1 Tax=Frondihabitans sucicola TaxID=1268041 RepID=A0ABM8GJJ1_9MICO|nr:sugar ABC transporter permease [Frondihabitans sucicola]BDZ48542.1 sugar ABC transporter permease [Frondihabitans sucicola]
MTTQLAVRPRARAAAPPKRSKKARRGEAVFGYAMIALSVVFVGVFTFLPILASLGLSFFSWDILSRPKFVGLQNYGRLLHDGPVLHSFVTTIVLAIVIVVLQIVIGLGLAVLVQQRRHKATQTVFRTVFYLPLLASTASVAIFMGYLFDQKFGVINYYLGLVGSGDVPWLTSSFGASVTIVLVTVWQQVGFTFVLISAALTSLPRDILEAAAVDGAGPIRTLARIKLPLISPTLFFATVVGLINAMQLFDQPFIMTKGGPGSATTTTVMVIYQSAFNNLQFGYGSAISIVLLLLILLVTGIQFAASRKVVFYQ